MTNGPGARIAERVVGVVIAALFLLLTAGMYDRLGDLRVQVAEVGMTARNNAEMARLMTEHLANASIHESGFVRIEASLSAIDARLARIEAGIDRPKE